MKIRKNSFWEDALGNTVKVSRLRKKEVCFYPAEGGGKEYKLTRKQFLEKYNPQEDKSEK